MILLHIGALMLALGLTPWLWARLLTPRQDAATTVAWWGPLMIALNVAVLVGLHLAGIPLTPDSLAMTHAVAALVTTGVFLLFFRRLSGVLPEPPPRPLLFCAALFTLLVIPVSHIAGIDTYKWQDLAGNVAVEERIAWFIHPLSLFGFTPRSYSSAQPLTLASIEMLGHTGVDLGFYILSVASGLMGLAGAWLLGRHLFPSHRQAAWFAFLYVFAPVFMRYNYWSTGRGFLLALLPLYLLVALKVLTPSPPLALLRRLALIPAFLLLSLLLGLSHKAGIIATVLVPLAFIVSPVFALLRGRWVLLLAFIITLGGGLAISGEGPLGLGWRLITRFAWLLPLAIVGLYQAKGKIQPAARVMLAGGFATLLLSCTPDMYGALVALPFVAFMATLGISAFSPGQPLPLGHRAWEPAVAALTLVAALTIVINQSTDSPNRSVYRAARFLEQHDPRGPYRVEAPGKARAQIQAYVSGCPRFSVQTSPVMPVQVRRPPLWTGHPAKDARHWIDYLRTALGLSGAGTDWYGTGNKVYTVTLSRQAPAPPGMALLFTHGEVRVYGPRAQE